MRFFLIIQLFTIPFGLNAYYPDSLQDQAVEMFAEARKLLVEKDFEQVDQLVEEGLIIFKDKDDLSNWMDHQRYIGKVWRNKLDDPKKALYIFNNCLNDKWREPQTPKERASLAWLLADIGWTYDRYIGDLISTREYYLEATKLFTDSLEIEDFGVAKYLYTTLGNTYSRLRDYENAIFYLEKVKDISSKNKEWDKWAEACSDIGQIYNNQYEYIKAIGSFEEGLDLKDSLSNESNCLLFSSLGLTYYHLMDYEKALENTNLAFKEFQLIEKLSEKKRNGLKYQIFINYGRIYKGLKAFELSESNYKQALNIVNTESESPSPRSMALMNINFGALYYEWGKLEASLEEFYSCLTNLLPTFDKPENIILPQRNELISEPLLIYTLNRMAEIFMDMYEQEDQTGYIDLTMECYRLSGNVEELILQEYFLEGSSLTVLKNHREFKENALSFLFPIWKREQSSDLEQFIFMISERSRSILLMENYQLSKALQKSNNKNESLLTQYDELNTKISNLEHALYTLKKEKTSDTSKMDSLKKALLRRKEELAKITKEVMNDSLSYKANSFRKIASIKDVQSTLSSDQILIEYFVGEENLFIIGITKNDFHIWQKELSENFEATINDLMKSITDHSTKNQKPLFAKSSHQLYNWLMKDVLIWKPEAINRLVLVPDGLLGYVPFDVLLQKNPDDDFLYSELDYLIFNYSISYAPSASLFVLQSQKDQNRAPKLFAGFAPKYKPFEIAKEGETAKDKITQLKDSLTRSGEYDLPGAAEEVRYISNLLNGDDYMQTEASESVFKQIAKEYQILLLSMHSLVDEDNPKFSTLLFTDSASNGEDDLLYALELSTLPLQADMAVLSACNTGFGKMLKGEGVMSFSRAFFSAGVPSTLMTLWKIPDASSSTIVKGFFDNLKDGLPKDKALQKAKLSYLKNIRNDQEAKPVFWAGFIAAGNMAPLDLDTGISNLWWLGGFLLLILAFLFFKYFK